MFLNCCINSIDMTLTRQRLTASLTPQHNSRKPLTTRTYCPCSLCGCILWTGSAVGVAL